VSQMVGSKKPCAIASAHGLNTKLILTKASLKPSKQPFANALNVGS